MKRINVIKLLARPYVLELLKSLKKPKRFRDLKKVCKNDKTLAKRIKELQENGLIECVGIKENKRYINHYKLTKRGELILKKVNELKL